MAKTSGRRSVLALAAFGAAWLVASLAAAAEPQPQPGFGKRASLAFTVEEIFGYQYQNLDLPEGQFLSGSFDSIGLQPYFWGQLGLFKLEPNGLTYGGLLGGTYIDRQRADDAAGLLRVGPRIGYASAFTPLLGYWARVGPSLFAVFGDGDDWYALAISGEVYAVVTPIEHVGILIGPSFDLNLWGTAGDADFGYASIGLTAGLMGEFW